MFCCSTVCGLWSPWLGKGHLLLFFSQCFASHPLPTTCVWIQGGATRPTEAKHSYHCQAPQLGHSQALCLSQTMWVCRELGSLSFPSPLSLSLSCPPTICLLTWPGVVLVPHPRAPVCVCVSIAPPNLVVMCYRWDLRLSVSASAARHRRKQDARGSTVISQCAQFHTIPGRSLYSLHAGQPLDIFMCQQSHHYWSTQVRAQ